MSSFELAIVTILKHEGCYVNDPNDPGGETKYGISKRSYPQLDIRNLTEEQAKEIYYRDWWDRYRYGGINDQALATKIFDMAVNLGARQAHKLLQRAANEVIGHQNIAEDGIIGPQTLAAVNSVDSKRLLSALRNHQSNYYRELARKNSSLAKFLRGWLNRAAA